MHLLYVSTLCSSKKFRDVYETSKEKPAQQAQKFHGLLFRGLARHFNTACVLSRPPINQTTNRKAMKVVKVEDEENTRFRYLAVLSVPILRHISLFFGTLIHAIKWNFHNRKEQRILCCDVLNLSVSVAAQIASRPFGTKSIAIITDLPHYMKYKKTKDSLVKRMGMKCYRYLCNYFLKRYDYYVVLTEQMNPLANPSKKPYVVIEGIADGDMKTVSNELNNKYDEKVIIYAGALNEKYGLKIFVEAFSRTEDKSARLWLFGNGDIADFLREYEQKDDRIRYCGVIPNHEVVREEIKATLLVNPRPTHEEFTKYSFPSKNMEYMVSGTPVLTTHLPGMPSEYNQYVYFIEDEYVKGMNEAINAVLEQDREILHERGNSAKNFVLTEKNSAVQAEKIMNMVAD